MHDYRRSIAVLTAGLMSLALVLHATPLHADEAHDTAARAKLDLAISQHYLATEFAAAERLLLEIPGDCAAQCSAQTLATVWMYLGLVRGVGLENPEGAMQAFAEALKHDPQAALDPDLATPAARELLERVRGGAAIPTPTAPTPVVLGGMHCSVGVSEVETRRPIPVACTTEQPASKAELKYREYGSTEWKTIYMGSAAGQWLGTIPCSATELQGVLKWYVNARDAEGEILDNYGAQRQPLEVTLVETSQEAPPAYPGQEAPTRCGSAGECPEEMLGTPACPGTVKPDLERGNKDVGEQCMLSNECKTGLDCIEQHCEAPRSCERDADCPQGRCIDLLCHPQRETQVKPAFENWIGLHFASDIAMVSGSGVCQDDDFACFYGDGTVRGSQGETFVAGDASAGNVDSGFALGTLRVLASYERLFAQQFGAELRAGFAFNGAPQGSGVSFLPIHAELRGKYWPLGAPGSTLFAPYVHLGGGLAQVDAKVSVLVAQDVDCNDPPSNRCEEISQLDAYRQMDAGFVSAGAGALLALTPNLGLTVNFSALYLLPRSGVALQPSLGISYGL